ncbi:MAG: type II secretion system F family protein [Lachnospiraceae bacterium]|nr:type II secretion system F family protein [Lachnospiraceae bacterium]
MEITLSSIYSSGIPISTCLKIAKTTVGNLYIESQFDEMIAKVRGGENLSDGIDSIDGFVKKLTSSVSVGEETGELDSMLVSIADQMDYDAEIATEKLVAMIEPVMIVIMAVIVGFIMIAIIQPIYGSYQSIADTAM